MEKSFLEQLKAFEEIWKAWSYWSEDFSSILYNLLEKAQAEENEKEIIKAISEVFFTATNIVQQQTKYAHHVSKVLSDTLTFISSSIEYNENVSLNLDLESVILYYKPKVDALVDSSNTWLSRANTLSIQHNKVKEEDKDKEEQRVVKRRVIPFIWTSESSWLSYWPTWSPSLPTTWSDRQSLLRSISDWWYEKLSLEEKILARQAILIIIEDVYIASKGKSSFITMDDLYDKFQHKYWSIDQSVFTMLLKDLQDDTILKIDTEKPRININWWLLDFKRKWYQAWVACAEALKSKSYQEKREEKIEEYEQEKHKADDVIHNPLVSVHTARQSAVTWYFSRKLQFAKSMVWVDTVSKQLKSYKSSPLWDNHRISFTNPERHTNQLFDYKNAYNHNQLTFLASQLIKDLSLVSSVSTDLLWPSNTRNLQELLDAVKNDWILGICPTDHFAQLKLLRPFIHGTTYHALLKTRKKMLAGAEKNMISKLHEKDEMTQRIRTYLKEELFASRLYNNDDLTSKLTDDHAADIYEFIRTWIWFFTKKPTIEDTLHYMLHHLDLDDTKKHTSTYNLSYQDYDSDERLAIAMEHVFNAHKKKLLDKVWIFTPTIWHENSEFGSYMHQIAKKREKDRSSSTERKRWSVLKDADNYTGSLENDIWESIEYTYTLSNTHEKNEQFKIYIKDTTYTPSWYTKTLTAWSTEELLAKIYSMKELVEWFKIPLAYNLIHAIKKSIAEQQWVTDCSWWDTYKWYNDKNEEVYQDGKTFDISLRSLQHQSPASWLTMLLMYHDAVMYSVREHADEILEAYKKLDKTSLIPQADKGKILNEWMSYFDNPARKISEPIRNTLDNWNEEEQTIYNLPVEESLQYYVFKTQWSTIKHFVYDWKIYVWKILANERSSSFILDQVEVYENLDAYIKAHATTDTSSAIDAYTRKTINIFFQHERIRTKERQFIIKDIDGWWIRMYRNDTEARVQYDKITDLWTADPTDSNFLKEKKNRLPVCKSCDDDAQEMFYVDWYSIKRKWFLSYFLSSPSETTQPHVNLQRDYNMKITNHPNHRYITRNIILAQRILTWLQQSLTK